MLSLFNRSAIAVLVTCVFVGLGFGALGCKGKPDSTPWCSASSAAEKAIGFDAGVSNGVDAGAGAGVEAGAAAAGPTYFRDVKPIVDAKCLRCHTSGGIGPFSLERWDDLYRRIDPIRRAIVSRHMPPWHAARCCTDYHADASLTDLELDTFVTWLDQGAAIGDAREQKDAPPFGGLSRVDVTLEMPAAYTPAPKAGTTDENRCFLLKWPLDHAAYVTGINPQPGERSIVHHLVVGILKGEGLEDARKLDGKDPKGPGFDCDRIRNMGLQDLTVLGGGLLGSDFPSNLGTRVEAGATVFLNVHYSLASAQAKPDLTKVQLKVDPTAREFEGLAVANPAWLVGEGMLIEAGEKDAVFHYAYKPTLFTRNEPVLLRSVTPHMHAFASKIVVRVIHEDGTRECLLEIPKWHFGWEQPFWFAKPKVLQPDDEVYVECHFDNHSRNDIAWGNDNQEMCAAFMSFTRGLSE